MNTKRALIVDDSKTACVVMARLLKQNGVESDSCYSGMEALEYLKSHKPSVIFMDHNMPGMDGFEVVKALKDSPDTAMIPVMMYTAKSGEDVFFSRARALGAIDVLPKELEQKHVQQALTQLGLMPQQQAASNAMVETEAKESAAKSADEKEKLAEPQAQKKTIGLTNEEFSKVIQEKFQQIYTTSIRSHISEQIYGSISEFLDQYKYDQNQFNKKLNQAIYQQRKDLQQQIAAVEDNNVMQWRNFEEKQTESFSSMKLMLLMMVFIIAGGAWYLWDWQQSLNKHSQQLQQQLTISQQQLNLVTEKLKSTIDSASTFGKQTSEESLAIEPSNQTPASNDWTLSHWEENANAFYVTSSKQYHAYFSSNGEISTYIPERFYLENDCFGNGFVAPEPGLVVRDDKQKMWYVGLNAQVIRLSPGSKKLADGTCENIENTSEIDLQPLVEHNAEITGVSDVTLSFGVFEN